ncbi:MAG: heparan-alpha-glucosaminide N-acetyltransferase domain-containing protein [Pseudomonadota bacterium]
MNASSKAGARIASIDVMRGLVILLMMVDHVRERFYLHTRTGDPMYDSIEADLFFTRMLTHLCAPMFILLAGVSAWLYAHPTDTRYRSPQSFLLKRGLVIILIEVVLYRLVWIDSYPSFLFLQVLFAIGVCMVALGLVCRLNYWLLGALGAFIVLGHNLLEPIQFAPTSSLYVIWTVLHDPGELFELGGLRVSLSYPVLPWFGVILLGYFAGPIYGSSFDSQRRSKLLLGTGVGSLTLLLILRGFNLYGETLPWQASESTLRSLMSFLNFTKYPPSLDYLLLTLGVGLLLLAGLDRLRRSSWVLEALRCFGSVPMFIYVVHLYVLLAAYWVMYWAYGANYGERYGLSSVGEIWLASALLIAAHYPLARWFANYKHREKGSKPWLSYF